MRVKSAEEKPRPIELCGRIWGKDVCMFVDNGSFGNFIDEKLAMALRTKPEPPPEDKAASMVNGSRLEPTGRLRNIKCKCGHVEWRQDFMVAPLERHECILGRPWLEKLNPRINWTAGVVKLGKKALPHWSPVRSE
jgi:hypothetical protein